MQVLTFEQARQAAQQLIEEKGRDYRYEFAGGFCVYVADDTPSCGVGHILFRLGVPLAVLRELDHGLGGSPGGSIGVSQPLFGRKLAEHGFKLSLDDGCRLALQKFQMRQDDGFPWGRCYDFAFANGADPGPLSVIFVDEAEEL
jgi:hypothetical protein